MNLSVLIPVLNENAGVRAILAQLNEGHLPVGSEILFLSGSPDVATRELVRHARVLHEKFSISWLEIEEKGIAAAWNHGLAVATGSIVVTMDGDGAHHLRDVRLLMDQIENGAHLAIASRHVANRPYMPGRSFADCAASRLAGWTFARRHRLPVSDPLHGFRARSRAFIKISKAHLRGCTGNAWMGDETLHAFRNGYRVTEITIPYGARIAGRENKKLLAQLVPFVRSLLRGGARE